MLYRALSITSSRIYGLVMLRKIIPYSQAPHQKVLFLRRSFHLPAHLQEVVSFQSSVWVCIVYSLEVFCRDWIDDGLPLLDPLFAVQIQDALVGLACPDAVQAIK